VLAVAGGRTYARRMTLSDGTLARAIAGACALDRSTLRSRGWPDFDAG
jgi:hypothetical protein